MARKIDRKVIEQSLKTLTKRQCQILYWLGKGWTYEKLALGLDWSLETITKEMSDVYSKLKLKRLKPRARRKWLETVIIPIHAQMVINPDEDCSQRLSIEPPEADPETIQEVIQDANVSLVPWTGGLVPLDQIEVEDEEVDDAEDLEEVNTEGEYQSMDSSTKQVIVVPPQKKEMSKIPSNGGCSRVPWALAGCLGLLFLAVSIIFVGFVLALPPQYRPFAQLTTPTLLVAQATATPQTIIVKETVLVTAIPTLIPTSVLPTLKNPTPTETMPAPTQTPVPTVKSVPTMTPLPFLLPFKDEFDTGALRPEWIKISGEPLFVGNNQVRAAGDNMDLEIGYNLGNYTVDFDYYDSAMFMNDGRLYLIAARKVRFSWCWYDSYWELFENNQWRRLQDGPSGVERTGHVRLLVTGNTYEILINGKSFSKISYGTPPAGPFGLTFPRGTRIAHFLMSAQ